MSQDIAKRQVIERMVACGWTNIEHPPFAAVVSQVFATATVPKEAVIYWYATNDCCALVGCYWSEGRNVLEGCRELIPNNASPETVLEHVDRFLQRVQKAIDDSYARRLYLQYDAVAS